MPRSGVSLEPASLIKSSTQHQHIAGSMFRSCAVCQPRRGSVSEGHKAGCLVQAVLVLVSVPCVRVFLCSVTGHHRSCGRPSGRVWWCLFSTLRPSLRTAAAHPHPHSRCSSHRGERFIAKTEMCVCVCVCVACGCVSGRALLVDCRVYQ